MNKYTPAPWKWQYWTNDGEIVYNVIPVMRPMDGQIENQADAQLIAAAPEMLEVLQKALPVLDDMRTMNSKKYSDIFWKAREVIAKAKGE